MMPGFATLARIAALALGIGIPAVVGVTLHRQYEHELAEAGTRAANTAHAVEQHAARTFEIIDTYLRAVAPLVGRHEGGLSTESVHAALREQVKRSRLYNIVIVDRDGRATVEGQVFPARALDIHDRDYFRTLRDRPGGGLLIGDPVTGRLSGKVLIPVARRIDGPDGSFSGIVQATLDPETFESVYAGIDNGPGAGLSLWRSDGTLLVRSPALPAVIGKNFADGENYRRHVPARDEAPYWTTAMTDGVERVIALGFLDDYPLYVAAALSRTDALAGWRRSAFVQVSVAGGLTLVLVAALLQLAREFERRRAADGRIRASEERYRLLAENTNDLIVLKPSMRERAYVSPAVRLVLGWSPEEYAALAPEDLIHPDEMTEVISVYGSLSPDRPQASHVHRLRHRDGHYVWIESVFRLVGNISGDRTVVVSGRDVTARIEADHALRASEARLRLVSEAAADMVTQMDCSGHRLYVSPASRDLLGYEPHELVGLSPRQMIHQEDTADLDRLLSDMLAGTKDRGIVVNRLRHRDGRWVWVEASLKRLRDGSGATTGFVSSVRNVEARKADEAALVAAREEAERASAAKGEFLAAMSHEIRTPLNSVLGYGDLLLDEPGVPPRARLHAERIRSAGAALLTLVDDVLDFSKIEAGQVEITPRPFAVRGLVENACEMVRGPAEAKGLILNVTFDGNLPYRLVGDRDRLTQIVLNLLGNACKFTRVGRVDVDVRAIGLPDGRVRLRLGVADTGVGVSASRRDRLFRRFSQADGSISRDFGGTGLGLAICKALVEAMGGTIGFDSQVGVGSTFWFEVALPLAPQEVTDRQPTRPVVKRVRRRLLLADDVALNRELAHEILTRAGHLVDLVEDGAAAVSAVRAKPYDLVLMDVQMPVLDGIAATRRIRASEGAGSRMPIVAMTANVLPEQVESFLTAGMDAHVGKPFRVDQLLDVIDRLTVAVPTTEPPAPTTDATIHDDLIALVGRERFDRILAMLAEELRERFPATASADPRQLAYDAHAMVSAAGALGFVELAQACREVEAACNGGHGYDLQLSTLRKVRDRTLSEIMALRSAAAA
ncbi:PAS domain S-box protein [Methylobacterium sp. WL6]|uniref:PAS domain S-box protein n=1 Tax=Methylobacterium sp. WL6 TaxID=2603901 RepID=UPI0011CAEB65|nr:PAS domain S-box protein [Methylobacterium sp. WL6]TXN71897.1 PAS domain S-box protein [Methylobacterium sp. WL6]